VNAWPLVVLILVVAALLVVLGLLHPI